MTSGNPQQQNTTQFLISTIWFFVLGMIGYFFLVTRPALQKEEGQKKFVSELKKGDEVLSSGGIYGKIHATGGDLVTVEIAPNVRIRVKSDQITPYIKPSGQEGDGKKGAIES
jgi:preprotein translocase subunit YajC